MTPLILDAGNLAELLTDLVGMRPDSPSAQHIMELVSVDGIRAKAVSRDSTATVYSTPLSARAERWWRPCRQGASR